MKMYRLIEIAPENGERYGKKSRCTLFAGPGKDGLKAAIDEYHASGRRRPWSDTAYYYGNKRIYAYEL